MKNNSLFLIGVITVLISVLILFSKQQFNSSKIEKTDDRIEVISGGETSSFSEFSGKILAGKYSPYIEFNSPDYEKAKNSGKLIFLDFYANWCPICRGEEPELKSGFDSLLSSGVIGFRVNYNDSDTDDDEKKLANQFGITYQHTKVILKNGEVILKAGEPWDKEIFLLELNRYL